MGEKKIHLSQTRKVSFYQEKLRFVQFLCAESSVALRNAFLLTS